jgi:hypothetical protein
MFVDVVGPFGVFNAWLGVRWFVRVKKGLINRSQWDRGGMGGVYMYSVACHRFVWGLRYVLRGRILRVINVSFR